MLDQSISLQMRAAFDNTISTLGVPAIWSPADKSTTVSLTVGFRVVGKDDILVINSYGVETRIITLATSQTAVIPTKFDTFTIGTLTLVVHAVHSIHLNADLIGYKCYAMGT
jgi:hypothetical protein